jgi:hypothetical protein
VTGPVGPEPTEGKPTRVPKFADFFFIGTACALSIVGAGAIGYGLDSWLDTTPWLTFAGLAFGITSAVLLTFVEVRKFT